MANTNCSFVSEHVSSSKHKADSFSDNVPSYYPDSRHLRSVSRQQLFVPRHRLSTFGLRGFSAAGPWPVKASSDRARRRASTNLHKSNERCQFKLYIGYWTSNNNKWPKCSCQTPPDNTCANDVINNAMT